MVTNARVTRSSGNAQIDNTALQAANSVRLPELPSSVKESYIEVSVEFMLTD
jgi:TonB family protein